MTGVKSPLFNRGRSGEAPQRATACASSAARFVRFVQAGEVFWWDGATATHTHTTRPRTVNSAAMEPAVVRRLTSLGAQLRPEGCASTPVGADAVAPAGAFAVALPESLVTNDFCVYRHPGSSRGLLAGYPAPDEGVRTLAAVWAASAQRYADQPCLGTRAVDAAGQPAGCGRCCRGRTSLSLAPLSLR